MKFNGSVALLTGAAIGPRASPAPSPAKEPAKVIALDICDDITPTDLLGRAVELDQTVKERHPSGVSPIANRADVTPMSTMSRKSSDDWRKSKPLPMQWSNLHPGGLVPQTEMPCCRAKTGEPDMSDDEAIALFRDKGEAHLPDELVIREFLRNAGNTLTKDRITAVITAHRALRPLVERMRQIKLEYLWPIEPQVVFEWIENGGSLPNRS